MIKWQFCVLAVCAELIVSLCVDTALMLVFMYVLFIVQCTWLINIEFSSVDYWRVGGKYECRRLHDPVVG